MDDIPFTYSEKAFHNLPGVRHEYKIRMDDIYQKAHKIDQAVEEYIKLVAVAPKYPVQTIRSAGGTLCLGLTLSLRHTIHNYNRSSVSMRYAIALSYFVRQRVFDIMYLFSGHAIPK